MVAVFNHLPVKERAAAKVVERFASSRGHVQEFPGLVSMKVLSSEGTEGADEVLEITR
jgi:heme-degrading monooxygenase HmoA